MCTVILFIVCRGICRCFLEVLVVITCIVERRQRGT